MAKTREEYIREEFRLALILEFGIGCYHHIPCEYLVSKLICILKDAGIELDAKDKNQE